ncbi:MAG: cytochrome c3 family protein [Pyrinomonadaceae bacterium]
MTQENRFIIIREDLVQDPVTIITDGLLIGRLLECELVLNHPAVSRAQAGIKGIDGVHYLFSLRPANPPKLNGKAIEENEALAPGDIVTIGPFLLEIDRADDALVIKVSLEIGRAEEFGESNLDTTDKLFLPEESEGKRAKKPRADALPGNKALDFFWDKRIREAGKMVRPSPLFPRSQRRAGKAQFNWTPTSDLARRWPVSFLIWGAVVVGVLSVAGAYWYANAYAPAPVSRSHELDKFEITPAIATKPNEGSCTNCHSFSSNMESRCASCHNTPAFVATVIKPHVAAGIGCVSCHTEHRGVAFKPAEAALATCTSCHNDANTNTYNERRVRTPHGGAFGYPVVQEKWVWRGLDDDDWSLKKIDVARLPTDTDDQWRSKQFHLLHVQRVRTVAGIPGNSQGELSCSSCHKSFNKIDRETPKTTCGACHNGRVEPGTSRVLIANDKPNCTSCHVQHVKDTKHWNKSLLADANPTHGSGWMVQIQPPRRRSR